MDSLCQMRFSCIRSGTPFTFLASPAMGDAKDKFPNLKPSPGILADEKSLSSGSEL